MDKKSPVLEARHVSKRFEVKGKLGKKVTVNALEDANVKLFPGEITALVGESGSGKTTLARVMALYYAPSDGDLIFEGKAIEKTTGRTAKNYYSDVQLLFQDPFASLNTLHKIRHILGRTVKLHSKARSKKEVETEVLDLLSRVNLTPPEDYIDKFPHELSGGQRQRVVIARALAVKPKVMLGDEPISMLDVSIRLDILNLLIKLRDEENLAMLYITHDIASARYVADYISVMYAGEMIESGPAETIIQNPRHPYTVLLLDSSADPEQSGNADKIGLFEVDQDLGEPPSLISPPPGCRFSPRCQFAMDKCFTEAPPKFEVGEGHWSRCWLQEDGDREIQFDVAEAQQPFITTGKE